MSDEDSYFKCKVCGASIEIFGDKHYLTHVSDDPKPLEDYDDWRDLPEAIALWAALEALIVRCADGRSQLLNEYAIVAVSLDDVDSEYESRYSQFNSSKMPHSSQGLLQRGIQFLDPKYNVPEE